MSGFIKVKCPNCGYSTLTPESEVGVEKPCNRCGINFTRTINIELLATSQTSQVLEESDHLTNTSNEKEVLIENNQLSQQVDFEGVKRPLHLPKVLFVILISIGSFLIYTRESKRNSVSKNYNDTDNIENVEKVKKSELIKIVEKKESRDEKLVDEDLKLEDKGVKIPQTSFEKLNDEFGKAVALKKKEKINSYKKRLEELEADIFPTKEVEKKRTFLENKASLTVIPDKSILDLHTAAGNGDLIRINELLDKGANVNQGNQYGYTALMEAAYRGQIEAAKLLISRGAKVNTQQTSGATGFTSLMWAVQSGKGDIVQLLIDEGAEIDVKDKRFGETALLISTYKYNPAATKILIEANADVNIMSNNGWTPLQLAASRGFGKVVKMLLDAGANANYVSNNRSVFQTGIESQDLESVQFLIKAGAEVNYISSDASYPLVDAIYYGNLEMVKLLLENGANVNLVNKHHYTPLIAACNRGYFDIAEYLILKGANVNAVSTNSISPLGEAVDAGQLDLVKALISRGADVNVKDSRLMTPLFDAVSNDDLEMVKLLVKYGADVNAVSKYGTLVGWSISRNKNVEILKCIIKSGCDFHTKDISGKTALDLLVFASSKQKELLLNQGIIKIENCFIKHNKSYIFSDELLNYCIETGNSELFFKMFNFITKQNLLDQLDIRNLKKLSFEYSNKQIYSYLDKYDKTKFTLDTKEIVNMDVDLLLRQSKSPLITADAKTKKQIAWNLFIKSLGPELMQTLPKIIEDLDKNKALYEVIRLGDLEALKLLVQEGADINWNNGGKKYSAVIYAMNNQRDIKILDYLLSLKPDFNIGGGNFRNALQAAGEYQNYYAFKKILESGQGVALDSERDFINIKDSRPRHYEIYKYYQSVGCKFTDKATKYLAEQIILYKKDNEEELAAFIHSKLSDTIKKYILTELVPKFFTEGYFNEKKADIIRKYFIPKNYTFPIKIDPLVRSVSSYNPPIDYLLENDIGSKSEAFKKAKENNSSSYLYRMVKEKIKFSVTKKTLKSVVGQAVSKGDVECVKYLKIQLPDYISDIEIVTAIINSKKFDKFLAAKDLYPEVFKTREVDLIHFSIRSSNLEVLDDLVTEENIEKLTKIYQHKIDEKGNSKYDEVLMTPLMYAVDRNKYEAVNFLLKKGANINGVTDTRETAFTLACRNNSLKMMEFLALKGANIQIRMRDNDSPWINAMDKRKGLDQIKILFKYGLSKKITDYKGNNPLHIAFKEDKPKIAKYLLELGISYLVTNDEGKLAEELVGDNCKKILNEFKNKKR